MISIAIPVLNQINYVNFILYNWSSVCSEGELKLKIVMLSKNQIYKRNWGRELFKLDMSKYHDVLFFGKGYRGTTSFNIPSILKKVDKTDLIFSSVFSYASMFSGFDQIINIPKVHWEVDYVLPKNSYPGTIHVQNPFYHRSKFDLMFGVTKRMVNDMKDNKTAKKIYWLPFSVSTDKYKNLNLERDIDVMSVFLVKNYLYPKRSYLQKVIKSLPFKTFTDYVIHEQYINTLNRSKIFVTSNNIYGSLNMKYTEIPACGTLLFANVPEDLNDVGFKDGENIIIYKNWKDLKSKIRYYLKNDNERQEIANNGMKLVTTKHSNEVRIKEMTEIIENEFF
jgi:hypothetical protein